MIEDTCFLRDEEIVIICPNKRNFRTFTFTQINEDGYREYFCECCGFRRLFPVSLPDSRFENNGYGLIESTNNAALGLG